MFLHIGDGYMIPQEEIVLIGDLDKVTDSEISREFFNISSEEGFIVDKSGSDNKIRSFILTGETIYYSMINSKTLKDRLRRAINKKNVL